ncbi:segregation/condensation protein A, partial [Proteus terrae]|nr:segregation/condensation protein A [Proteus terrae]
YRTFKYAADQLSKTAEERSLYYPKDPMDVDEYKEEEDQLRANQFNTIDLFLAFQKMIEKKKNRQVLETKISPDESTIDEKMAAIQLEMQHVSAKKGRSFDSFFTTYNKTEVVVTFMALLELMKKGTIRVEQTDNYASILLYPTGKEDE